MEAQAVALPGTDGRETTVAVKYLKDDCSAQQREQFAKEAAAMQRLQHDRVVRLLAVCLQSTPCFIVLEHMANGDAKTYLRLWSCSSDAPAYMAAHQLALCRDIAAGAAYLSSVRFVHRDLAARNVLLDGQFRAKIGDFGMSRVLFATEVSLS